MESLNPVSKTWRVRIAILLSVSALSLMPVIGMRTFLPLALRLHGALSNGEPIIIVEPSMFSGFLVLLVSLCILAVVGIFAVYPPMRAMPRTARAIFSFPLMLLALLVTFKAQDVVATYMVRQGYSRCEVRDEPRQIKNGTTIAVAWTRAGTCKP